MLFRDPKRSEHAGQAQKLGEITHPGETSAQEQPSTRFRHELPLKAVGCSRLRLLEGAGVSESPNKFVIRSSALFTKSKILAANVQFRLK